MSQLLFSEIVFDVLLRLLNKEVSDHSRHLQQYFQVFLAYAHKGPLEVSLCDVIYVYVWLEKEKLPYSIVHLIMDNWFKFINR